MSFCTMEINKMKIAVIGVGNMGSQYASLLYNKQILGAELTAITRVGKNQQERMQPVLDSGIPVFQTAEELYTQVVDEKLEVDGVIIATPHYFHEEQIVMGLKNNLHVLSDKPLGVYSRQARNAVEAHNQYARDKIFGTILNQRTQPIYQQLQKIIQSGKYGKIKRLLWVVTDWYRPEKYFSSSSWHSTWKTDGGGILLNQCPHNLDLLQWICGMPNTVQAFCQEGRYHNIEVEDNVTAYMEWDSGATGIFITSTGELPGINRLEISLDEAMIVCENNELRICELSDELGMPEAEYRATSTDFFKNIKGQWKSIKLESEPEQYKKTLQNFVDSCLGKAEILASGEEGSKSLYLSNAMYLSSWIGKKITLPHNKSEEELFEKQFEEILERKKLRLEEI